MERTMRASILLGLPLCAALAGQSFTSRASTPQGAVRTQIQGIDIPTVANVPFTARVVVTWNQRLNDGSTLSKQYYTMVARDSQGRVRRETRDFVPANSSDEPPLRSFTIFDPVAGTRTVCYEASMKCAVTAFRPSLELAGAPVGAASASAGDPTHVNLGQQTMDGLTVIGARVTSGAAGTGGSNGSASPNTESWYSPDLRIDLDVVRSNPQTGQVTLHVRDLVRGEPDSSWFAIPSGFQVKNARSR
jgi:hypothetical protein